MSEEAGPVFSLNRKRWIGPTERGECEHGVPYLYRWTWKGALEDEDDSEPEFVQAADCNQCYPDDEEDLL